jgi:hypothetical protein
VFTNAHIDQKIPVSIAQPTRLNLDIVALERDRTLYAQTAATRGGKCELSTNTASAKFHYGSTNAVIAASGFA